METYIKMLSETQWIRGTGEGWQFGDRFVWGIDYGQNGIVTHLPFNTIGYPNILWLPSVEQLMEMLTARTMLEYTANRKYHAWEPGVSPEFHAPTAREALLQLLQYAHDGSRWDTERWVKG